MKTLNPIPKSKLSGTSFVQDAVHNESGAVLVVVLLLLLVLAGLVPAVVNMSRNDFVRTTSYEEGKESFYIADTGVQMAKKLMKGQYKTDFLDDGLLEPAGTTASKTVGGITQTYNEYAYGGGKYWIRVDDNTDGTATTEDSDNVIIITSLGQVDDGPESVIKATTWKMDLPPSIFPSALTMVGPASILNTNGSKFKVYGADQAGGKGKNIDGTVDNSCPGKSAVAFQSGGPAEYAEKESPGPPAGQTNCQQDISSDTCLLKSGGTNTDGNYVGVNSNTNDFDPGQAVFNDTMAMELHDLLTNDADGTSGPDMVSSTGCDGGPCYFADDTLTTTFGNQTWGTQTDPVIAYVEGGASMNGVTGYGILIVDKDFQIAGQFTWNGIVLVGVCDNCSSTADDAGGTGSGAINGAFVVGNGTQAQVDISGAFEVNYSCEGIGIANGVFAGNVNVVAWNEEGA